ADAVKRPGAHARGLVDRCTGLPRDKGTLDRTPAPRGPVGRVSVPDRPVEDENRSGWATRKYLPVVGAGRVLRPVRLAPPQMPTRHETRGPIVRVKFVHHDDETDERPPVGSTLDVHVKRLRWHAWLQRPGKHRAQLERVTDDPTTGRQHRTIDIEPVELGPS